MARQLALSVISGLAWISAIAASTPGTSGQYLEERNETDGANCTSPTNISVTCWYQLDIPTYLTQWGETHPTCNATANETDCCISGEPWSMCFMRLAYASDNSRYAAYGLNCTGFGSCHEPPLAPSLPSGITIQEFYVLNTIYTINALFTELNEWLLSVADAGNFIPELDQTLQGGTLNASKLSTAFSAGLPFLAYTTFSPGIPQPPANLTLPQQSVLQSFLQSLQSTPILSTTIWPPSSPPPSNLPPTLSTTTNNNITLPSPSPPLSTALSLLLTSLPPFLEFTTTTTTTTTTPSWSTTYPPTSLLPQIPTTQPWLALANGATTYAYSTILQQNNFSAIALPGVVEDQTLYQQNKTCTAGGVVCMSNFDMAAPNNTAEEAVQQNYTYYWSPVTHRQYQFVYGGGGGGGGVYDDASSDDKKTDPWTVLQGVEASGTSLPVLFDGAYTCGAEGRTGGEILSVSEDGMLDFSCFSELFVKL